MDNRRFVVLFGDSLLMDAVEASLGNQQELDVMRVHTKDDDVEACLRAIRPDLVIFDWDTPFSQFAAFLLRDHPGIPLIGLDIASREVVVLSSQQYTPMTARDLAQVIQLETFQSSGTRRGEHISIVFKDWDWEGEFLQ
jgi:hypothetical protein